MLYDYQSGVILDNQTGWLRFVPDWVAFVGSIFWFLYFEIPWSGTYMYLFHLELAWRHDSDKPKRIGKTWVHHYGLVLSFLTIVISHLKPKEVVRICFDSTVSTLSTLSIIVYIFGGLWIIYFLLFCCYLFYYFISRIFIVIYKFHVWSSTTESDHSNDTSCVFCMNYSPRSLPQRMFI